MFRLRKSSTTHEVSKTLASLVILHSLLWQHRAVSLGERKLKSTLKCSL